ncbi:hypothetical protein CA600_22225 [Paenibacillus sp. VTT E-133280]|uniref:hypothetical protein n=1 Tax=unclassified Paenibacillus TaxID=185978 RepID=UPI000BA0625A|nr:MULTISPECIES: hypothetical protein [unclassified Paenibacillus]OZQ62498.1 hypothetical protein CA600_22225 [Paenibacillus sp. VTT E-133280]OZQ86307.1 hypothetical protein CA598_18830 [Paenibacillus sp. VTT E-133291]
MWKPKIQQIFKYVFIIICIVAFGIFIYPGIYKYDKLDQKFPVLINRITGETKILFSDSWSTVGNIDAKLSEFESYKNEILEAINSQNEQIKESVIESVQAELDHGRKQLITETASEPNPTYEDGTSVFDAVRNRDRGTESASEFIASSKEASISSIGITKFGLGDTKETVKKSMGTPSSIINDGDTWFFGSSIVNFDNGIVIGWVDPLNALSLE